MAIYHCNITVASRAEGASAVAGAAYLSRSRIECERDGIVHDYTRAHQHEELVADLGVSLPERAPERWRDRAAFWNEVERVEKKSDAQLARRIECALPDELTEAQQIALARQIVADRVADGHVVDACMHRNVDGHNAHLHMLEPLRRCDERGFMAKSENVYTVRSADGDERRANAAEFKELKGLGYEKVYKWRRGNEWRALTATEAARPENSGFKRHGKTPVQETRYLNDGWNDKERAEEWRSAIAQRINEALERGGVDARVDHRSYERQGVATVPQLHEGSRVRAVERRERLRAESLGTEYRPVCDRVRENAERRRGNAAIVKASAAIAAIDRAVEQARDRAGAALGREMDRWRERMGRARALLLQPRRAPGRAVSDMQAAVYASQASIRLERLRAKLMDPRHRSSMGRQRDLTRRELSFLTRGQRREYESVREAEREAERQAARRAAARRRASSSGGDDGWGRSSSRGAPSRGRGR